MVIGFLEVGFVECACSGESLGIIVWHKDGLKDAKISDDIFLVSRLGP